MTITEHQVSSWLEKWAEAIRSSDFATGRAMFSGDVVAFGTLAGAVTGIQALIDEQWRQVWPRTRGFAFSRPLLVRRLNDMAVVAVEWSSEGGSADATYGRAGRATLVLEPGTSGLVCTHSHVSMMPGTLALREEGSRPRS